MRLTIKLYSPLVYKPFASLRPNSYTIIIFFCFQDVPNDFKLNALICKILFN